MASPDVLASCIVDLADKYEEQFTEWSPVFEKIVAAGNKETLQSYQKEFVIVTDGPGQVTNVVGGSEIINGGRNQTAVRGNEVAPRLFYAFDVPGIDLDEANGENDLAKLIAQYPDLAMVHFQQLIAEQLVMGNAPGGTGGFITWNGDATYDPKGTARTGIFTFAAPASQTSTVHGIPKEAAASSPTPGWSNQYIDITSFATNGRERMRQVYWKAARKGASGGAGPVDLMFCDETWYSNYVNDLDEPVRFVDNKNQQGDPAKPNVRQGIAFLDATLYLEEKIAPASFVTANAQDGVCYGINSRTWHMFKVGRGGITKNNGFFSVRPPVKHPTQDLYRYEIIFSIGMYCNQLRANFVATGGATA